MKKINKWSKMAKASSKVKEQKQKIDKKLNFQKFLDLADVLKDEIYFQKKVENCSKALNEILFFNKYLHTTTLEYMAKCSELVESGNYS